MKDYGEELEGRIAAYIDGELPPAEAARLEVFLANTDPALAQQVIGMIAERHAVRSLPRPPAPEDLAGRIMEQVERTSLLNDSEHFTAPRRPWWQSRLAVAAALILILGGFSYFILEAVRRPDSSWRQTVMEDTARHDEGRDLAAARKTLPTAPAAGMKSAPSSDADRSAIAAATPQKSVAPAPAMAPNVPAAVTPAQQSVGELGADRQPTPVAITLAPRTAEEETRLRLELARFAEAAPGAANRLARQGVSEGQQQASAGNGPFGSANSAAASAQSQLANASNASNANEQFAARAAQGGAGVSQQKLQQNTESQQSGALQVEGQLNKNGVATFNAPVESRRAQDQLRQGGHSAYRVALHPDQLRQLVTDFPVRSETALAIAGGAGGSANEIAAPAVNTTQAAAKDVTLLLAEKPADEWIDCDITVVPPPATASTTAPQAPAATAPAAPPLDSPAATEPR